MSHNRPETWRPEEPAWTFGLLVEVEEMSGPGLGKYGGDDRHPSHTFYNKFSTKNSN